MSMVKCPECGKEVSDKAVSCPSCGYIINDITEKSRANKRYAGVWILLSGIIFEVIAVIYAGAKATDNLGEEMYYIYHGYYLNAARMARFNFIYHFLEYGGFVLIVIGIIMIIVFRKKKR